MRKVSYKRHIAKTLSWRLVGTLDTILLSWLLSGDPITGLKIGFAELITKMLLYYMHERTWLRVQIEESKKRHFIKAITWRGVGTLDTIALSWLLSGNPILGLKIGFAEIISKMFLYYIHERLWYRINFGLEQRDKTSIWKKTL